MMHPRLSLVKAGRKAPQTRFRLVKAGTPEWLALEVPETCPNCGAARVVEGPAYDRAAWRCFGCGATPSKPKPPKSAGNEPPCP